ncbi:single-stranded DNA-binding protein [Facklamia miroungae]|uniref:Single-stranded DNA-binding protein n=1 Tax=Facklamia miroungae TaxID=120956 RepID=A0A1G7SX30_9LACT|nr:single-stranded DNA-binding protein [Facklamia miroungae]NKZ29503.1 single-stranded DNA-binding protein [Facklamia miroungae]SDG27508.1 single-strand DNA-binding protein [Facklamia miroungae]
MNTVQLVGRLTKEIDLRYTSSGTPVGSFTLAVNRSFTNQQGEREADFINCVIWRKAAENLANFTRKGSQIGVEGRIQTRSYDNQQGQKVYVTEVVVSNFHLLEPRSVTEQRPVSDGNQSYKQNNPNTNQYQGQPNQSTNNDFGFNQNFSQNNSNPFGDSQKVDISEDDLPF